VEKINNPLKKQERKKIVSAKQINLKEVSSVLIITPFHTEEFILSTPAIAALKEAMPPESEITVLTTPLIKKFAATCRSINKILEIKTLNPVKFIQTVFSLLTGKFNIILNFNDRSRVPIMAAMLNRAPVKVGYLQEKRKMYNRLYNISLHSIGANQHIIVKYLNLVRFIGANSYDFTPKITLSDENKAFATDFLKKNNITDKDIIIGIHPTLKDQEKRWSLNKFSLLVKGLIEKYNAKIVVVSHKHESEALNEFMHITKNQCISASTHDYMQLAAISRYFCCFICNETDFMHVFAPFTNIVVIWGDSDPEINKPSGHNNEVLQAMDKKADSVTVSAVLDVINNILKS